MGHVVDRWTRPGPSGRRVRSDRYGSGKRWLARWVDPDGRERSRACVTKDEAVALLARVDVDTAAGMYVSPRLSGVPFRDYASAWAASQHHHRASTREATRVALERAMPHLGARPVGAVRRSDVQAMVTALVEHGLAAATVRQTYGAVAAVFRVAVEDRVVQVSPCVRISLPALDHSRVVPLTLDQVAALRTGVPDRWAAMVDLGAGSGLRPAEMRGLTIDRLDPALHLAGDVLPSRVRVRVDRQLVEVGPGGRPVWGPPKTRASDRTVTIGPSTVAALVGHLRAFGVGREGLVFTSRQGGAYRRGAAAAAWRVARDAAGLERGSGWHELRHFHASLLIADGLSVRAVADRLGHADPTETLRTYAHLWPDDEERSVAAVEGVLAVL